MAAVDHDAGRRAPGRGSGTPALPPLQRVPEPDRFQRATAVLEQLKPADRVLGLRMILGALAAVVDDATWDEALTRVMAAADAIRAGDESL